jgi:hypothetical protein
MNTEDLITALIQISNYQYFLLHGPKPCFSCICIFLWINEGLNKRFSISCTCVILRVCHTAYVAREKQQMYGQNRVIKSY